MGNPFTEVTISGYNVNPPSDDGVQIPANRMTWAGIKTKLADPIKTGVENMNTNVNAAFGKISGGINKQANNYTILASDQGKTIVITGDNSTVTLPSVASVQAPFLVSILNISDTDLTIAPNGASKIDGETSLTIVATGGIILDTDGTDWFSKGQNYKQSYDGPSDLIRPPEGYLTLTSNTPIITGDVAAATAVYYTPDVGEHVPVSDGSAITMMEFSQLTLSLHSNHLANAIYDVFLFNDNGTLRIGTGPAWNNAAAGSGARGTGAATTELERWKGLFVNKAQITARNGATTYTVALRCGIYLGSVYIDGSAGQVTCHRSYGQNRKWGIWNCFNRKRLMLKAGDGTSSWTYGSGTIRQSNGQSGNRVTVFSGLAEEMIDVKFNQAVRGGSGDDVTIGIGWNATNAFVGFTSRFSGEVGGVFTCAASHINTPFIGIANVNSCEVADSGTINAIYGTESQMQLAAEWRG